MFMIQAADGCGFPFIGPLLYDFLKRNQALLACYVYRVAILSMSITMFR